MENDYKVADINLAEFGRREISLAENEMPALMALREKYRSEQPLAGAKIMGCIHMTIQTPLQFHPSKRKQEFLLLPLQQPHDLASRKYYMMTI